MKVLFTGASSFTGFWFVRELAAAGHEVVAIFRKRQGEYADIRGERVRRVLESCTPVFGCEFGSESFLDLIDSESSWDVLCHHAADVTNYKSMDFDISTALARNTLNLRQVLQKLQAKGCNCLIATGSVFELNEGAGEKPLRAFSPYGLSKSLSWQVIEFYGKQAGFGLGKFVIPNPFGPFEEPRFTHYLMKNWFQGRVPSVNTPAYVRDNIHVSLLSKAYRFFVEKVVREGGTQKLNPSGYVETQGAFAKRFAAEMAKRLPLACDLELKRQTEFPEPRVRINTDILDVDELGWSEDAAWDKIANYYKERFHTMRI